MGVLHRGVAVVLFADEQRGNTEALQVVRVRGVLQPGVRLSPGAPRKRRATLLDRTGRAHRLPRLGFSAMTAVRSIGLDLDRALATDLSQACPTVAHVSERERAEELLRRLTANPQAEFHEGQWEAIEQLVVQRSRALVVQRTGWGKSAVYFIATRLLRDAGAGATRARVAAARAHAQPDRHGGAGGRARRDDQQRQPRRVGRGRGRRAQRRRSTSC